MLEIEIVESNIIDGGIEVFARVWENGQQIGFGKDGTVDIERFRVMNPPVFVDAEVGEFDRLLPDENGELTIAVPQKEDPEEAILQSLEHTISQIKNKHGDENIVVGKRGNTTSTIYASHDGTPYTQNSSWNSSHDNTTAYFVAGYISILCGFAPGFYKVRRPMATFDTSGIDSGETISSATLSAYQYLHDNYDNDGDDWITVVSATPANDASYANADFDQVGDAIDNPTEGTDDRKDISSMSTLNQYYDWSLNATGIGWINKSGNTVLGWREGHDVIDSPIRSDATGNNFSGCYGEEDGANDPKLVIEHSYPDPTNQIKGSTLQANLVSYWDLEEASGTRYDLHGSNNLTDNNTVTSETGKVGNAGTFVTGNSEFLSSSTTNISGTTDKSLAFWAKIGTAPSSGTTYCLFSDYQNVGNNRAWGMMYRNNGGTLEFYTITSANGIATSTGTISQTLTAGTWYHLAFLYDKSSGSIDVYVNGSSIGQISSQQTNIYNGSDPFRIGALGDGGGTAWHFDGAIDEFGLWDKLLSSDEVSDLYNSGSGLPYYAPDDVANDTDLSTSLTSYWELDDNTDSAGSNNLTEVGSPVYATGISGNAIDLEDSSSQYATATNSYNNASQSISMWINAERLNTSYSPGLLSNLSLSPNRGFYLRYDVVVAGTDFYFEAYNSSGTAIYQLSSGFAISASTWYHVVVAWDTSSAIMYVNGVQRAIDSTGGTMGASSNNLYLGNDAHYTTRYFDGLIDETAIWSKKLGVDEVRALYGYGTPPVYEAAAASTIKSIAGITHANMKSVAGIANASIKSIGGVANV